MMPYTITLPNGKKFKVKDGVDPQDAVRQIMMDQFGYDPAQKMDLDQGYQDTMEAQMGEMSTGQKLGAGFIAGLERTGRNATNLLLPESLEPEWATDEAIRGQDKRDKALRGTTAGAIGGFGGEVAGLAPLGAIGAGARTAAAVSKGVPALGRTLGALASRPGVAALEGAAAGAIAGGPDNRKVGAVLGAVAGPVLERTMAGFSRVGVKGLAKVQKSAKELMEEMDSVGVKSDLPASLAIDGEAGALSSAAKAFYQEFMAMMPITRSKLEAQGKDVLLRFQETVLRKTYPRHADEVVDVLKNSTMRDAIEAGEKLLEPSLGVLKNALAGQGARISKPGPARQVLTAAASRQAKGEVTPKRLASTIRNMYPERGSKAPLIRVAEAAEEQFAQPIGKSSVFGRSSYHKMNAAANKQGPMGALVSIVANTLGLGGVLPRLLQSQGMQNFVMGSTGMQKALQKAAATSGGRVTKELAREIRVGLSQALSDPSIPDEIKREVKLAMEELESIN